MIITINLGNSKALENVHNIINKIHVTYIERKKFIWWKMSHMWVFLCVVLVFRPIVVE